jgi:hypothetical protein
MDDEAQPEAPQIGESVRVAGDEADSNVPPVRSH